MGPSKLYEPRGCDARLSGQGREAALTAAGHSQLILPPVSDTRAFITAGPTEPDPHQERHSCFLFALVWRGSDKPRGCPVPGLSCPATARPLAPERLPEDGGPGRAGGAAGQADPCCEGEAPPTPSLACAPVWADRLPLPPSSGSPADPGPGPRRPSPHSRGRGR